MKPVYAALLALFLALPLRAEASEVVACLQNQLRELGHDPGPVDGLIGGRTRAAFRAMQAERGDKAFAVALTKGSAYVLCRELGLERAALMLHWPSRGKRVAVGRTKGVSKSTEASVLSSGVEAVQWMLQKLDVRVAGPIAIEVYTQPHVLSGVYPGVPVSRIPRKWRDAFVASNCEGDVVDGFARFEGIGLCLPGGDRDFTRTARLSRRPPNLDRRVLDGVVFHEIIHAIQYQLSGIEKATEIDDEHGLGPLWLIEGSATYLTILYTTPEDKWSSVRNTLSWSRWLKERPDLAGLAGRDARSDRNEEVYVFGAMAAAILADRSGERQLLEYYRRIGLGMTWRDSFEQSFGLTPEAFDEMF